MIKKSKIALVFSFFVLAICFRPSELQSAWYTDKVGLSYEQELVNHVENSIEKAYRRESKLDPRILNIHGMSSEIIRRFLNNVCSLNGSRYLEIGVWKGSTLVSALYQNEKKVAEAVAMDNWSEWGGPKNECESNILFWLQNPHLRFCECDCFSINPSDLFNRPVNIYFYDGDHSFESQKKAFTYFNSILDETFITMVDDWNAGQVRDGTFAAFEELGYRIVKDWTFFSPANSSVGDLWWNGFYIAVVSKK